MTLQCMSLCKMDLNFYHYENTPIQIYRKFHLQKLIQVKKSDIFNIPG